MIQTLLMYVGLGVLLAAPLWKLFTLLAGPRLRVGPARVQCLVPYIPLHQRPASSAKTKGQG